MSCDRDVLHVYDARHLAEAVYRDRLTAVCGEDLTIPATRDGHPLRQSRPPGESICAACLSLIGPKRAAHVLQKLSDRVAEHHEVQEAR